jgi:oxygen-independent coproporphyrinogen-3 oxidase
MYELASDAFASAGFLQYEISNWARPDMECRHNMQYWRGLPYLGLGAGAHGYAGGVRTVNALRIATYVDRMARSDWPVEGRPFPWTPATVSRNRISTDDEMSETMMMGLRLTEEGVSSRAFAERFGVGLAERYGREIDRLVGHGLVEWRKKTPREAGGPDVLRLTRRGRLLGNQVFVRFVL